MLFVVWKSWDILSKTVWSSARYHKDSEKSFILRRQLPLKKQRRLKCRARDYFLYPDHSVFLSKRVKSFMRRTVLQQVAHNYRNSYNYEHWWNSFISVERFNHFSQQCGQMVAVFWIKQFYISMLASTQVTFFPEHFWISFSFSFELPADAWNKS